jgi:creatinine amidohydrolase
MRLMLTGSSLAVLVATALATAQAPAKTSGVALVDLSWVEAEAALTPEAVVVIPLGVAAVEHGPHLKLNNNERLARYLASRVQSAGAVVIAPPLTYHFYPAFLEYPGSISLTMSTARDMTVEIVRSLARYGPRRFYALNTGVSTVTPLRAAADVLASYGVILAYTDMPSLATAHADENETSMMLYIDPSAVDMTKAVKEYGVGSGPLTRQRGAAGLYSATGVVGDPTLATRDKGQALVESLVSRMLGDIENLRRARPPDATRLLTPAAPATGARPARSSADALLPSGCTAGDERAVREVGARFSSLWSQMDSEGISLLFTEAGDIRHPDGTIERGQTIIRQNRRELFMRREYRGSVHPVSLTDIRCLGPTHAIADGKWELRLADSGSGGQGRGPAAAQRYSGWCTLVLIGGGGTWAIDAWRYTIDPPNGSPPPTTLKQPGFIGREQ